jgi:hypothetical protein
MPMPNSIIKLGDRIGLHEKQGWEFRFLNRSKEPYEWTGKVPQDNPVFQGLLEEEAPFPDISAKIPGVPLEEEEYDIQVVMDKPKPVFEMLAAAALENAGINVEDRIHTAGAATDAAHVGAAPAMIHPDGPHMVEAYKDKIVYDIYD